jgi:hypothetical protein
MTHEIVRLISTDSSCATSISERMGRKLTILPSRELSFLIRDCIRAMHLNSWSRDFL